MLASRVGLVLLMALLPIFAAEPLLEKDNLDIISKYTDVLCPYNVICREGEPRLKIPWPDRTGACTDCSCAEDCGLREDCCYPQLDRYKLVDRGHHRCIYPITTELKDGMAYNMVVDDFPNGKGKDCYTEGTKCGDDQTATRLGALYPVFSPKTGRIYANMKCARCHGLNDDDVIMWKAYLACEDSKITDISMYLKLFADGNLPPSCSFKFVYPGSLTDLKTEQCHRRTDTVECLYNVFSIPDDLNMTRDEIKDACHSDLTSPTFLESIWYKNAFCRLCGDIRRYVPTDTTLKFEEVDKQRLLETPSLALLEPEMLTVEPTNTAPMKTCSMMSMILAVINVVRTCGPSLLLV